jgi:hypothetical protein
VDVVWWVILRTSPSFRKITYVSEQGWRFEPISDEEAQRLLEKYPNRLVDESFSYFDAGPRPDGWWAIEKRGPSCVKVTRNHGRYTAERLSDGEAQRLLEQYPNHFVDNVMDIVQSKVEACRECL